MTRLLLPAALLAITTGTVQAQDVTTRWSTGANGALMQTDDAGAPAAPARTGNIQISISDKSGGALNALARWRIARSGDDRRTRWFAAD